ncbi:MAG: hypothetical protein PHP82_04400 [Candidatus ainarchaeum sp.]|nr:hypothetical protein [Candidatus ainarchaeum sp.]
MIELAWLGMILIIISWIIQIFSMSKGKKEILKCFAILQAIGIIFLVISDYLTNNGLSILGMLNILSMIGAIIVLVFLIKK